MSYYTNAGQMDLTDRIAIETGICRGESFKQIARRIRRHPSTVAHEVKENRTRIGATYCAGKDCRYARKCMIKQLCGAEPYACDHFCKYCKGVDCRTLCERYESAACHKPEKAPYVCNTCPSKRLCTKEKYFYSAKYAEATVKGEILLQREVRGSNRKSQTVRKPPGNPDHGRTEG